MKQVNRSGDASPIRFVPGHAKHKPQQTALSLPAIIGRSYQHSSTHQPLVGRAAQWSLQEEVPGSTFKVTTVNASVLPPIVRTAGNSSQLSLTVTRILPLQRQPSKQTKDVNPQSLSLRTGSIVPLPPILSIGLDSLTKNVNSEPPSPPNTASSGYCTAESVASMVLRTRRESILTFSSDLKPHLEKVLVDDFWNQFKEYVDPETGLSKEITTDIDSKESLTQLCNAITQEIDVMARNPEFYRGKATELESEVVLAPPKSEESDEANLKKIHCVLQMSEDGKEISCTIRNPKALGEGTFKIAYAANTFGIQICQSEESGDTNLKNVKHKWTVLLKIKDTDEKTRENRAIEGFDIQRRLSDSGVPTVPSITISLPTSRKPSLTAPDVESATEQSNMVLQPRRVSMKDAFATNEIRVSFDKGAKVIQLTPEIKRSLCLQLVDAIDISRHIAFHRDLKSDNIYLTVEEDENGEVICKLELNDFDMAIMVDQAANTDQSEHPYWDEAARHGWILPSCDTYGAAMCLGSLLIPNFEILVLDRASKNLGTLSEYKKSMLGAVLEEIKRDLEILNLPIDVSPPFFWTQICLN